MRILYFHQHFTTPRGASGTRSYEFARALIAQGHTVTMVCGSIDVSALGLPPGTGYMRGTADGIDIIALPVPYSNRNGLARRAWVFAKFALRSLIIALREPCDLVFATSTPLTVVLPGVLAKIFRRKPFVFEVRDLWPALPRALGMRNPFLLAVMSLLEYLGYRAADGLVGLSPGIVDGIKMRSPQKTPIEMIPNGCDLDLFKPLKKEQDGVPAEGTSPLAQIAGLQPGDFVAGFTGAHGIANGLEAILAAATALKRRGNTQIKFLFVGDGNCKEAMVAQARRDGLDNCIFLPPMPKTTLARLTASLDCGLMVLRNISAFYHGTSPNKFFDYIAAGIPVLNNYPGWLAGLINEAGCGAVVPPDLPEAFAEALENLAATARVDNNATMRRAARQLAETQFSREKLTTTFCEFLAKISARKLQP
ncbi:MAG: glycosyltransferase family 4 protein [Puniceicoccales bacterium]|jgi:glycosyltransferase involved in cell wall biosynthesis|nr:glycosyltransferase family 4 protein [Puniceicoccales bacterium]